MTASEMPGAESALEFGATLRRARTDAGMGVRQLAAALGASPATVSAAERGSDLRHSTMNRYLELLPGLTAHHLLGEGPPGTPSASMPAWRHFRQLFGFSIGAVRFRVSLGDDGQRLTEFEAKGVTSVEDMGAESTRRRVYELLFRGSSECRVRLASLCSEKVPKRLELEDGCFHHAFRVSGETLSYRRTQAEGVAPPAFFPEPGKPALSAPFSDGLSLPIDFPIEELKLELILPPEQNVNEAHAACWSDLQSLPPEAPDLSTALHPEGIPVAWTAARRCLSLKVQRPVFGLYYGFGWDEEGGGAGEAKPGMTGPGTLADVLAAARAESGSSRRELADRLGISPVTVARAEEGHDVRRSTLKRYLDLPNLSPDLLLQARGKGVSTREQTWQFYRSLLGVESDAERKSLVINRKGDAAALYETLGLRRVRPTEEDLRVRFGSAAGQSGRWPTELKAVEEALARQTSDSSLRTRVVARREGRVIHEIIVPSEQAQQGVSFSRRMFTPKFFDATATVESCEDGRLDLSNLDGAAITPFHAVRLLHLEVTFPRGYWPSRVWFGVHPRVLLAGPTVDADLAAALHPTGFSTHVDPDRRVLSLTAEFPLIGFIYDIFWAPPQARS